MEESSSSSSSCAAAAEYEPLLLRLDSHSQIPRLSSESIQHLMERRPAVERRPSRHSSLCCCWISGSCLCHHGLLSDPTVSLDSISICVNYLVWDLQFMSGLSTAASIRVGNELGAGHPRVAEFSVFVVNGTSIVISIILCAIVLIFRVGLSKLFTSNTQVIEAVSDLCPLLAFSSFLNGIQPILSGVAIGCGWQGVVAYINLASYYVIGLTIGYVLGFKTSLGVAGIWWGMIIGVSVQTFTLIILTSRTNWDYEVEKAVARVKRSEEDETLDRLVGNVQ